MILDKKEALDSTIVRLFQIVLGGCPVALKMVFIMNRAPAETEVVGGTLAQFFL